MSKDLKKIREEIDKNRAEFRYDTLDYPIKTIFTEFDNGKFIIPKYQREYVWTMEQKSKFIESILIGLPIPTLFLYRDKERGILEIVDGTQRIQTVYYFLKNELKLTGLKRIKVINDCYFKDLPEKYQNIFESTALRCTLLEEKTDDEFRRELFNRINTTSQKLEPIEVLLGTYDNSEFIEFLKKCSSNELYKKLCPISSEKKKRKEDLELILRFFAYSDGFSNGLEGYNGEVSSFLEKFTKNNLKNFEKEKLLNKFENMLNFVDKYFPNGFAKSKTSKSTPRNRFEAISVGVNLALQKNKKLDTDIEKWIETEEFRKITTSDSANNKSKLIKRIEFVKNKLLGDNI